MQPVDYRTLIGVALLIASVLCSSNAVAQRSISAVEGRTVDEIRLIEPIRGTEGIIASRQDIFRHQVKYQAIRCNNTCLYNVGIINSYINRPNRAVSCIKMLYGGLIQIRSKGKVLREYLFSDDGMAINYNGRCLLYRTPLDLDLAQMHITR